MEAFPKMRHDPNKLKLPRNGVGSPHPITRN